MGDKSKIEWTDATWNPITGCSKVSPGCAHCYAETLALTRLRGREGYPGLPWTPENAAANVVLRPERLDQPLRWRRPRRIFVNSLSDVFHELVPDEYVAKMFAVMALARRHTFQVLTKRPATMRALVGSEAFQKLVAEAATRLLSSRNWQWWQLDLGGQRLAGDSGLGDGWTVEQLEAVEGIRRNLWRPPWPLPNVWLGTSVENQHWADIRIPELLATPAAVRFLSCEPLLGPLDLSTVLATPDDFEFGSLIDWIIVGGESGPIHRPIDPTWVRRIRDQANYAGVPFLFKQWGGRTSKAGGRELDGQLWDGYPDVPSRPLTTPHRMPRRPEEAAL